MVFSTYRFSVVEIVRLLNRNSPLISARAFFGQQSAATKAGAGEDLYVEEGRGRGVGMNQKQQKQVMQDFLDGRFNVLVATSIGSLPGPCPRSSLPLESRCGLVPSSPR